ncbi:MAG TPA: hypothetical protein VHN79_09590, partial [Lacunisphaera sp.]|nr:hypothetical protein [Lacunisphaera sp.]
VSPATPKWVQVGYGLWMSITTATWFVVVAIVFTRSEVRRMFLQYGHWIDRVLGMVFLGFAASLVVGAFN